MLLGLGWCYAVRTERDMLITYDLCVLPLVYLFFIRIYCLWN